MSAYATVQVKFKDQAALAKAICKVFNCDISRIMVSNTPLTLVDYRGHNRPQTANVVIPGAGRGAGRIMPGASNDLGFLKGADGTFSMIVSDYDRTTMKEKLPLLQVAYAEACIRQTLEENGYFYSTTVKADGQTVILAEKY